MRTNTVSTTRKRTQKADQKNMVMRTKRKKDQFNFETRQRAYAIARVLDDDIPVSQAAEEIGAGVSTVYGWIYKTIDDPEYTGIRLGRRRSKYFRIKDS